MIRKDPGHLTVCDRCYRGTWYAEEGPCRRSRQQSCPTCHQGLDKYAPCGGTLRIIDPSNLAPGFTSAYQSEDRVRVRFSDGTKLTGTIGKTMGWHPVYILMRTARSTSSIWTLSAKDRIVAVRRGRTYIRTYFSTESTTEAWVSLATGDDWYDFTIESA